MSTFGFYDVSQPFALAIYSAFPYIPPFWAFGYGQSRWGYKTEQDIRDVAERYKEAGIPLGSLLSFFKKSDFNELSKALAGFIVPDRSIKGSGIHIDGKLFNSFLNEALSFGSNSTYNSELRFERKLLPTTTDKDYSTEICQSMGFESGRVFKDNKTTYLYFDTVSEPVSKGRFVPRTHKSQPTPKSGQYTNGMALNTTHKKEIKDFFGKIGSYCHSIRCFSYDFIIISPYLWEYFCLQFRTKV